MVLPESAEVNMEVEYEDMPSKTFIVDRTLNRIIGIDEGVSAMVQAVDVVLNSERFQWQIYGNDFGVELNSLIGKEYAYIVSEFPRRVKDAFSVDERIMNVENFRYSQTNDRLMISFDVVTVYGIVSREVEI